MALFHSEMRHIDKTIFSLFLYRGFCNVAAGWNVTEASHNLQLSFICSLFCRNVDWCCHWQHSWVESLDLCCSRRDVHVHCTCWYGTYMIGIWPRGYKFFFMANSDKHEISTALKNLNAKNNISSIKTLRHCIYSASKCLDANNCWHFNI